MRTQNEFCWGGQEDVTLGSKIGGWLSIRQKVFGEEEVCRWVEGKASAGVWTYGQVWHNCHCGVGGLDGLEL